MFNKKILPYLLLALVVISCSSEPLTSIEETYPQESTSLRITSGPAHGNKGKRLDATLENKGHKMAPRSSHTSVVHNNRMWILAGRSNGVPTNDVLWSTDGATWHTITPKNSFPARYGHASVVFNNRMWVIGGKNNDVPLNDVWSSSDGINWELETTKAAFTQRYYHKVTVFNGMLWLNGGFTQDGYQSDAVCCGFNDLWRSSNGIHWERIFDKSYGPNMVVGHQTTLFKGNLVIVGGNFHGSASDISFSSDGEMWVNGNIPQEFVYHGLVIPGDDRMWTTAGKLKNLSLNPTNHIYYSSNGSDWHQASTSTSFEAREHHTSVFYDNKIWVINGQNSSGEDLSDVWSFSHPDFQHPSIGDITW